MTLDPKRILNRVRMQSHHNGAVGFILKVAPREDVVPFKEFLAAEKSRVLDLVIGERGAPRTAAEFDEVSRVAKARTDELVIMKRWHAGLEFWVAADPDGQEILRATPFTFPADPLAEGLVQARYNPDGIPDLLPEADPGNPGASVNPRGCLVTKSTDPCDVARWWWSFNFGGFPKAKVERMRTKSGELLRRTDEGSGVIPDHHLLHIEDVARMRAYNGRED